MQTIGENGVYTRPSEAGRSFIMHHYVSELYGDIAMADSLTSIWPDDSGDGAGWGRERPLHSGNIQHIQILQS
jgi:hypothetical protein